MLKGPGVGAGVGNDGQTKGLAVASGVAESVGASVSVGASISVGVGAAATIDGVDAEPCAAAVPIATQAADASITHKAA